MMAYGACETYEPIQYKEIDVWFVKIIKYSRYENGKWQDEITYLYLDKDKVEHELTRYYGEYYKLSVRR